MQISCQIIRAQRDDAKASSIGSFTTRFPSYSNRFLLLYALTTNKIPHPKLNLLDYASRPIITGYAMGHHAMNCRFDQQRSSSHGKKLGLLGSKSEPDIIYKRKKMACFAWFVFFTCNLNLRNITICVKKGL